MCLVNIEFGNYQMSSAIYIHYCFLKVNLEDIVECLKPKLIELQLLTKGNYKNDNSNDKEK